MKIVYTPGTSAPSDLDDLMIAGTPMQVTAVVVGTVEYREGDGVLQEIRHGMVDISIAGTDAVFSWSDDAYRGVAVIPYADFSRHVRLGTIRLPV